ncbi:MAG: heavy metal translocating P-type ATPase, partial [Rhizobiaceae bacterium]|nr:heavy metal translocating P-type ATPase [Rhizobiaceae bacterium]
MDATEKTRFTIEGMDCAACAAKIDKAVRQSPGVRDVSVSATAGTMLLEHEPAADLQAVSAAVSKLGYRVAGFGPAGKRAKHSPARANDHSDHDHSGHDHSSHDHAGHDHAGHGGHEKPASGTAERRHNEAAETAGLHGHDHGPSDGPWWKTSKAKLTIACGLALGAAMLLAYAYPQTEPWSYIAAMAIGLIPIARRAFAAARIGMPFTIETLMTIAAVGAVVIDAGEEAAVVVFLFLVGELLEGVAAGRARASIRALATLVPKTALLEVDGRTTEVPAESLVVGSVIMVRPGDRIPADGTVLSGTSAVDEAPVTGESVPKRKAPEDAVYAGTINQDAVLRVTVTAAAQDNTVSRIIRLVEEAQESKAPTERFIDSFSKYYTPGVLVVAALIAVVPPLAFGGVWDEWVYK